MSLVIEKRIDLTAYADNPAPKFVSQLSIIHEADGGELVQYYIHPVTESQGDKATHAIGILDEDTQTYSYVDYDQLVWDTPKQRVCGNRIERLGVKAFPGVGAIAFYKLRHRKLTRIAAPVNRKNKGDTKPGLEALVNQDGTITFTITPPSSPAYACYRIVMQQGIFTEEYVTYDHEITVPPPQVSGEYRCFAVGYGEEGQLYSKDSEVVILSLAGRPGTYKRPYYMRSEIAALEDRIAALEAGT